MKPHCAAISELLSSLHQLAIYAHFQEVPHHTRPALLRSLHFSSHSGTLHAKAIFAGPSALEKGLTNGNFFGLPAHDNSHFLNTRSTPNHGALKKNKKSSI